jgi:hypothetical protein
MEVQANVMAMINALKTQSLNLGVYRKFEPMIIEFVQVFSQNAESGFAKYTEMLQLLHKAAKGADIIKDIPVERLGPKQALLVNLRDNTYHAHPWKDVLLSWKSQPRGSNTDPYARFMLNGTEFSLANKATRAEARAILQWRHGKDDAIAPIFLAQRYEANTWTDLDEEVTLEILKLCVSPQYHHQTRATIRIEEAFGYRFTFTKAKVGVRSIVARGIIDDLPLNLRILDADPTVYGVIFSEVLVPSVVPDEECSLCFSDDCICNPSIHKPSMLGCGKYIHSCCLQKALADARQRRPDKPPACPWCLRLI